MVAENQISKDLRVLNYDLKDVAIVDNQIDMFRHQLSNGIPILSFYSYKQDRELKHLLAFLQHHVLPAPDVRPVLQDYFKLEQLAKLYPVDHAIKQLYL